MAYHINGKDSNLKVKNFQMLDPKTLFFTIRQLNDQNTQMSSKVNDGKLETKTLFYVFFQNLNELSPSEIVVSSSAILYVAFYFDKSQAWIFMIQVDIKLFPSRVFSE